MKTFTKTLLFLFCILPFLGNGQTVSTLAGPVIGIDDGLILDDQGLLYGSGYDSGIIYTVTAAGVVSTFYSGLQAANGLAWDGQGNLVVCDNTGNKIYKINPTDTTVSTFVNIASPSGIIKDPLSDTLYFTSYVGNTIYKLAPDSSLTTFAAGMGLDGPVGLAWDDSLNLLVGNFNDNDIHKIYPDGRIRYVGNFGVAGSQGFIAYLDGYIYGTMFNGQKVMRMDSAGNPEWVAGSSVGTVDGPAATARFNRPNGIVPSQGGDSLYISGYTRKIIRIVSGLDSIGFVSIPSPLPAQPLVEVFPSPATDHIWVRSPQEVASPVTMGLYTLEGKLLKEIPSVHLGLTPIQVDLNGIVPGVYYLRIWQGPFGLTKKVVIRED